MCVVQIEEMGKTKTKAYSYAAQGRKGNIATPVAYLLSSGLIAADKHNGTWRYVITERNNGMRSFIRPV